MILIKGYFKGIVLDNLLKGLNEFHDKGSVMRKMLSMNLKFIVVSTLAIGSLNAQLEVGDTSPDFGSDICMNGEDVNPDIVTGDYWSLFEEGVGKVTWINLFTSW